MVSRKKPTRCPTVKTTVQRSEKQNKNKNEKYAPGDFLLTTTVVFSSLGKKSIELFTKINFLVHELLTFLRDFYATFYNLA
jgi:hypothetical protein